MKDFDLSGLAAGFVLGLSTVVVLKFMKSTNFLLNFFKMPISIIPAINYKMVLVVRTDLNMGKGKIAAQCCHAALGAYKQAEKQTPEYVKKWMSLGQPKIVVKLDNKEDEKKLFQLKKLAVELNVPCNVVHDAGHTQVARGTATVAGFGPAPTELLDKITGDLKLL